VWAPIGQLFETYDALICPTWTVPGIAAGDSILGQLFDAGGGNDRQFTCFMTTPFNILAPCPVLAVPSGVAPSNGVPTGIQIVARTYDDVTAFRIGAALEQVRPWTGLAPFAA
jgi:Asp-tRNA(Asn)/Glu-tRNA(Gln) amidotransferase A subunit family amidase